METAREVETEIEGYRGKESDVERANRGTERERRRDRSRERVRDRKKEREG